MAKEREFKVYTRRETNPLGDKELDGGQSRITFESRFWFTNQAGYDVDFSATGEITRWDPIHGDSAVPAPHSAEALACLAEDLRFLSEQIKKTIAVERL